MSPVRLKLKHAFIDRKVEQDSQPPVLHLPLLEHKLQGEKREFIRFTVKSQGPPYSVSSAQALHIVALISSAEPLGDTHPEGEMKEAWGRKQTQGIGREGFLEEVTFDISMGRLWTHNGPRQRAQ